MPKHRIERDKPGAGGISAADVQGAANESISVSAELDAPMVANRSQ